VYNIKMKPIFVTLICILFLPVAGLCTTVAWSGTELASDSQATCGHHKTYVKKMVRSNERHATMAAAGNYMRIQLIMQYFISCTDPLSKMDLPPSDDEGDAVDILVVFDSGDALYYGGDLKTLSIVKAPFTLGAGGDIALGALAAGKTAAEAVAIAEKNDLFSSGDIQVITAPQKESPEESDAALQGMIDKLKALKSDDKSKDSEPKK
jgi:hypothetical protein